MTRMVCIVDDDDDVRDSLELLLQLRGYKVRSFASARAFLEAGIAPHECCVVADIRMPEMDGLALQREITRTIPGLPVIMMTGHGDVPMAVRAMKEGAVEFLEKPFEKDALFSALDNAFAEPSAAPADFAALRPQAILTDREREVFELLVEGDQNKMIAHKLSISIRTVEVHRARVLEKMGARNLADLVKRSLAR